MSSLHKTIDRKFIESFSTNEWEIWTDTGWEDISASHLTIEYEIWEVITASGKKIRAADDHILFDEYYNEIFVKDLVPNKSYIITESGAELVACLRPTDTYQNMYDITVNSDNHRFYGNGVLSHNTTTAAAVILHYVLFNEHKTVALLANKGDAAREILERIKLAYESLPKWLQQGVDDEWNKGSIALENGCKIIAASTSSSAIRGKSISFLYIDETAFVENWDEFFASVFPTISSGKETKILFTSTPKGLNHYYQICKGAKENTNGYQYVEVSWERVPGRDESWRLDTLSAMNFDEEKFAQEFCCQFIGSSGTLINGATLKRLYPTDAIVSNDEVKMYEHPVVGRNYVLVADVSRGKGLDYSAFSVIDVTEIPYKQVCTYRNNLISPSDYAEIIYRVSRAYNECTVLVEINDIGEQVTHTLYHDYECESLISTESAGAAGKRISTGFGKRSEFGIRTTKIVKSVGCSMLKLLVEQDKLILQDGTTIQELSRFSRKGNSYEAEAGAHDDMVMGLVLFAWMTNQQFFRDLTDINTLKELRERSDRQIEEDMLPFGFHMDGTENATMDVLETNVIQQDYNLESQFNDLFGF